MKMFFSCPKCQESLTYDVDKELLQEVLTKELPYEEASSTSLDKYFEEGRKYAKDYSDVGDAGVSVWPPWRWREFDPTQILERCLEYAYVVQQLRPWSGLNILDVGSAQSPLPGVLSALGHLLTSLDAQGWGMSWAGLEIVQGDLLSPELPFRSESFDLITCVSTIEHIGLGRWGDLKDVEGDFKGMQRLREYLKPQGRVILTLPAGPPCVVYPAHRVYNYSRFQRLIRGFKLLDQRFFCISTIKDETHVVPYGPEEVFVAKEEKSSLLCCLLEREESPSGGGVN